MITIIKHHSPDENAGLVRPRTAIPDVLADCPSNFYRPQQGRKRKMIGEERYDAYMVRIWQDGSSWRAQVLHVHSGQRRFFTNLGQLCLFWQEETAVPPRDQPHKSGDHQL